MCSNTPAHNGGEEAFEATAMQVNHNLNSFHHTITISSAEIGIAKA